MGTSLLRIHPINPQERKISQVVELLKDSKVIIYPTDSVYAIGCSLFETKAIQRICQIKKEKAKKFEFSIACEDVRTINKYAKNISNNTFKLMKYYLPGPYTFILEANKEIPKIFGIRKKQIAVKIYNNKISNSIIKKLEHPLLTISIEKEEDSVSSYLTDAEQIYEKYKNIVDIVIDGGVGNFIPSTIIESIGDEINLIRQGSGEVSNMIIE